MLFEVSVTDPVAFLAAPTVFLLVAALACLVPAVRAARTQAIVAIRSD
jgi:ABC-type lipoprotein release transport system permease subunit